MLLNQLNVDDKGFVAMIDSYGGSKVLQNIQDTYFSSKINMKLLDFSGAILMIKCPLFVQLNICQFGFNMMPLPSKEVEVYIPDISQISGQTLEDREEIFSYIQATSEALILNQKGLSMDGADAVTSQLLMPISTYNEIIVSGSLKQWFNYLNQTELPNQINNYQKQIENCMSVVWKNISTLRKM